MKLKKGDHIQINPDKNSPYTIIKNLTKPQVGKIISITKEPLYHQRVFVEFTHDFYDGLHCGQEEIKSGNGYNFFTKKTTTSDIPHTTTLQKISKAQYTAHLI